MSKKKLPKKLTRREFGLASVSAGLGALLVGPELALAQEQQQVKKPSKLPMKEQYNRARAEKLEKEKLIELPEKIIVDLIIEPIPTAEMFAANLYLVNRSSGPLQIIHRESNVPYGRPDLVMLAAQKKHKLEARVPMEDMMYSRMLYHDHKILNVVEKGNRGVLFAKYVAEWPQEIKKSYKDWVGKEAFVSAAFEITPSRFGTHRPIVTRSGKPLRDRPPIIARAEGVSFKFPDPEAST